MKIEINEFFTTLFMQEQVNEDIDHFKLAYDDCDLLDAVNEVLDAENRDVIHGEIICCDVSAYASNWCDTVFATSIWVQCSDYVIFLSNIHFAGDLFIDSSNKIQITKFEKIEE